MFLLDIVLNTANGFRYLSYKTSSNLTKANCQPSNTMAIAANFSTSMLRSIIPASLIITLDILMIKILYASKVKQLDIDFFEIK